MAAAYGGSWAAGTAGMWGGGAAAGQPNSLPFPAGFYGAPNGMMAGVPPIDASSLMFLPLLQPQVLPAGMQPQFGMAAFGQMQGQMQHAHMSQSPLPSPARQEPLYAAASAFQPPIPPGAQQPAARPALRPIRTRAAASTGQGGAASGTGACGSMPPPPPVAPAAGTSGTALGGAGLDLAELLSPLAASLLSPLGLNGSPAGELDVLAGAASSCPLSPNLHALHSMPIALLVLEVDSRWASCHFAGFLPL